MRKFSVIFLIMVFGLVFTQDVYPDGFGIKGGVNFARLANLEEDEFDYGTKTGLIFGAFYRFDLGDRFAIQPEICFSMKGAKAEGEESAYGIPYSYDIRVKLNYLEIPVLLKYKFHTQGKLKPSLFAGPYVGFNTSAKMFTRVEVIGIKETEEEDVADEVRNTDFGLIVGASLDYDIGHSIIIIEVRYSMGLTRIPEDPDASDAKNSVFTLMLGYAF